MAKKRSLIQALLATPLVYLDQGLCMMPVKHMNR